MYFKLRKLAKLSSVIAEQGYPLSNLFGDAVAKDVGGNGICREQKSNLHGSP